MMRLMALDIGERRIGIAISDHGFFAKPHGVLQRHSKQVDYARLQTLIAELRVERVIVGLPYSLSGEQPLGPQARRILRYTRPLAKLLETPLEYFDESYSTVDAQAYLAQRRASPHAKKQSIPLDAAAAAVILQQYLDQQKSHEL
jgi:putative Holliday junction resolvase